MKNVFFIQRAAIDVLLLNKATAIEISTYLVICKYTDRHGYESGVGYKAIKERLGVGQRKVNEAIRRLKTMEFCGQRLLYSKGEWLYHKTGAFPRDCHNFGWIRGWFESEYRHNVWLHNALVGKNGDPERPLNYFVKASGRDNHARLLLLLYKYHNRQYSGVNYKFVSITSEKVKEKETGKDVSYRLNGFEFHMSRLGKYHISQNILKKIGIFVTYEEAINILKALQANNFLNVSISVIGVLYGPTIPATTIKKKHHYTKPLIRNITAKQIKSYKMIKQVNAKTKGQRITYKLAKIPVGKGTKAFAIGIKRCHSKNPLNILGKLSHKKLIDPPGDLSESDALFCYRLDYKSNKKRDLIVDGCLAGYIEEIVQKCSLKSASRKGKFYDTYWWFNPGIDLIRLVGIVMPIHIPSTRLSDHSETIAALGRLNSEGIESIDMIDINEKPCQLFSTLNQ